MNNEESIHLLQRLESGDADAAKLIFDRYVDRLLALASSRISNTLRRRVEADDVVQSAYGSFFRRASDGAFEVQQSGQLWGLLAAITINKVRDRAKFHTAQKRNMSNEQSMHASSERSCYGLPPGDLIGEPTAEEVVGLSEILELTLQEMNEQQRQAVELHLQNTPESEIAKQLRRSERTVRRILETFRKELESRLLDETS